MTTRCWLFGLLMFLAGLAAGLAAGLRKGEPQPLSERECIYRAMEAHGALGGELYLYDLRDGREWTSWGVGEPREISQ